MSSRPPSSSIGSSPEPAVAGMIRPGEERGVDSQNSSELESDSESVFSQRSGILDPLIKAGANQQEAPGNEEETLPYAETPDTEELESELSQLRRKRDGQTQALRNRRKRKKFQVFLNRMRFVLKLVFAVFWAFLLWHVLRSPLWVLESPTRFSLENAHLLTKAQLAPLIRPWVGKPLYRVDVGQLSHRIQAQFPALSHVMVRRELFPARLNIVVSEKLPWAELYAQPPVKDSEETPASFSPLIKPYGLIAENAMIPLSSITKYHPGLYPGHTIEPVVLSPSTRYKASYIQALRQFTWKMRHVPGLHLLWTDAQQPDQVKMHFRETSVILGRLDAGTERRLTRIIALIPKINELQGAIESVDLRWEEQVTLHTRPNALIVKPESTPRTDG